MLSDHELLSRWRANDIASGQELRERHNYFIHTYLRPHVYKTEDVEELVRATFMTCLNTSTPFQDQLFRPHLLEIAKDKLREYLGRRIQNNRPYDVLADRKFDTRGTTSGRWPGVPSTLLEREEQNLLLSALHRLPRDAQFVLHLHLWEKLTAPQIGELLDVPVGTVASRIRIGKARLLTILHGQSGADEGDNKNALIERLLAEENPKFCAPQDASDAHETREMAAHLTDEPDSVQAGQTHFKAEVCRQYFPALMVYLRLRLPTESEQEQVITATFKRLFEERTTGPGKSLRSMLFSIAADVIAKMRRASFVVIPKGVPRVFLQRYETRSLLGRGGMATVYAGFDRQIEREVAIKVFHAKTTENSLINNIIRGNRSVARLAHPFLASIFEIDVEDETPLVVMELIRGSPLDALVRTPLAWPRIVQIILQLCAGLSHLHRNGLIHGDIKPSNVVLTCQNSLKLIDFDLCMLGGLNRRNRRVGSYPWMSPEQILSGIRDARGEIFSVGVILYQMVTGNLPFNAGDKNILEKICSLEYTRPERLAPTLPPRIGRILRMLLNERNSRYNSIAKLMEDLESTLKDAPCATWIRSPPQAMPPLESLDAADGEHPTNNETTRQRVTFTHLTAATANRHTQGVASRTGLELFHDKLCSFFTFDEYRRFLLSGFQGNRLLEHLRENQSYSGFVLQSLELLARRGLIDSEFFARLLEERPRRADEIFALAQQLNLRL